MADRINDISSELLKHASGTVQDLLTAATQLALQEFNKIVHVEQKPDISLVTSADKAIEAMIVQTIRERFPDHQIIGEEYGSSNSPQSDFVWLIDPIDGTENFVNGVPTYGCIIGLHYKGTPIVAGTAHPSLGLTYHAIAGQGAYKNGERFTIKQPLGETKGTLSPHEIVGISSPKTFMRHAPLALMTQLFSFHPTARIYYDCFAMSLAAEGSIGVCVETFCKIWDFAAAQLLVEEAGGKFIWLTRDDTFGYSALLGKPDVVETIAGKLKELNFLGALY